MTKHQIILQLPSDNSISEHDMQDSLKSIIEQMESSWELIVIGKISPEASRMMDSEGVAYRQLVEEMPEDYSILNPFLADFQGEYFLFIDARKGSIQLKKACLKTFELSAKRNPESAFFYADYEIVDREEKKEIKLLFHHIGRLRDNQDYGSVYFIRKSSMEKIGFFGPSVRFNHWYDIRLKLAEKAKLIRIGNKYSGSLYAQKAAASSANVFDYLMAGKDVQIEAENILTNHLKRIGAYLEPGKFAEKPSISVNQSPLKASVIIPVGHRPEFIGTAIESIQAQSVRDIEAIIVVNGGEKDPTADVVRRYMQGGDLYDADKPEIRLMVIDINNIGLCLNLGAEQARGKYYVQLDSDDRLKADAVEKILETFDSDPAIGMVIGSYEVWEKKADGKLVRMDEIPVVTHDEWTEENGRNNLLRINGAGAPRSVPIEVIKAMGYFSINDDAYARNYGEDYEMVNKIAEYYRIGRVYDPIYEVVRHAGGTDHAISQDLIDRNDEAKDDMRREAVLRRIEMNK